MEPDQNVSLSPDQQALFDIESAIVLYDFVYKTVKKSKAKRDSEDKTLKAESAKMIKSIIEALKREQSAFTAKVMSNETI
jgi:hypothetical protein